MRNYILFLCSCLASGLVATSVYGVPLRAPRITQISSPTQTFQSVIPGIPQTNAPNFFVTNALTVGHTLTVQDLDITGSVIFPSTVDFTGELVLRDDSATDTACLLYKGQDGTEKARICSKSGPHTPGLRISADGGVTEHLAISGSGTVSVAKDVTVGQGLYSNNLFIAGNAQVNGTTQLQNSILQGTTTVQGPVYYAQGVPALPMRELVVTKGTLSGPNQFSSIKAAVDSITTASAATPFIVRVGPGVFVEDTIVLKPYVLLVGAGDDSTVIMPTVSTNTILYGAPYARVSGCAFVGATGIGGAAIRYDGGGVFEVYDCVFGDNETLISLTNGTTPRTFIRLDRLFVRTSAQFAYGIRADGSGVYPLCGEIKGITWLSDGNPLLQSFFFITGSAFQAVLSDLCIGTPQGTPGTGLTLQNGAVARLKNSQFFGFAQQAIYVPNVGIAPTLNAMAVLGNSNAMDVVVEHPGMRGVIDGIFARDKISVVAGVDMAMFLVDGQDQGTVTVGPQYAGTELKNITYVSPIFDDQASMGVLSGGQISRLGGLAISVAPGAGYLGVAESHNDVEHHHLRYVNWLAQTLNLPAQQHGFLYVDALGTVNFSSAEPDPRSIVQLGRVTTSASDVLFIQETYRDARTIGTNLDTTLRKALGPIYVSGSLVSKLSASQLAVSQGRYYHSTHEIRPSGASPASWITFYRDGASGYITGVRSSVDYSHYDDGTGVLAVVPADSFIRHAFYVVGDGAEERYLWVYGREVYASLLDAQNGSLPPAPSFFGGSIALIASIITKNSVADSEWVSEIRDERPRLGFKASGLSVVTAHGDLSGLGNDDHLQYLLANGTRALSGSLNMEHNQILNAGLINGVAIAAHASRHRPGGADALPVGTPVTLGLANVEGIENTFARADHIHAHGDLAGGSLHGVATSVVAGFMAAADKSKLDSLNASDFVHVSGDSMTGPLVIDHVGPRSLVVGADRFVVSADTGQITMSALGQGVLHAQAGGNVVSGLVDDADIDAASQIAIGAQKALSATATSTANHLVLRDSSGNFSANTITANLSGTATTATNAINFSGLLSGDVTGPQGSTVVGAVSGVPAATIASGANLANAATSVNTVNQIVRRDASGNFAAGTITANLTGNASTATSATSFTGALSGDVTGTQGTTVVASVGGQAAADVASASVLANAATNLNTANQIVKRDASGNFAAGTITANLVGNASTATSATSFTGQLNGDVTGAQGTTVVASVGGQSAADVASSAVLANAATNLNTASQIVRRDASGNFAAGTITANLAGNASTATSSTNFAGALSGDVTGSQGTTVVASVGGQAAADVASASVLANAATNLNTASQIVRRDASGNFAAGTITANLTGNASTATSSTNFTGALSGDVTGTQGTTVVASVGGQAAADLASAAVLANAATSLNTASQIVRRDASGNFVAGTITANLIGNASTATSATSFTGALSGDVTGSQSVTVVASVGGQVAADVASASVLANAATNLNTASQIVRRDASGNFAAGTITASLAGNASTATSATSFTGALSGDVTGSQSVTVVASVGGQAAADVASAAVLANAATNLNTAGQIVRRDASGNFTAGTITANLIGSASLNVLKSGDVVSGPLTLSGVGSSLSVDGLSQFNGDVYFSQGVPALPMRELVVTKGTLSGPNQFSSVKAAVDSITTASAATPFIVRVGPGVFVEDPIVLKPYVLLVGAGDDSTVIMPTASTNTILHGAPYARVSGCAFVGATGVGGAAIRYDGGGVFEVYDCVFGDNETLISLTNGTTPRTFIRLDRLFVRTSAQFAYGIRADGSGVYPLCGEIKGITWLSDGNPLLQSFFFITGAAFQAVLSDLCVGTPQGTPGTGLTLQNGAVVRLKNSQFFGFAQQAIYVPNVGVAPTLNAMAVLGSSNVMDVVVEHPGLQGVVDGIFARDKISVIDGAEFAMFLVDATDKGTVTVGPQYAGTELKNITYVSPLFDDQASTGVLVGGGVSVTSGLDVYVAAGSGYLLVEYIPEVNHGHLRYVKWVGQTVSIPADSEGYLFVSDDGVVTFSSVEPNPLVKIILGRVRSSTSSIVYIQNIARNARNIGTNIDTLLREALGPIYVTGSLVTKVSDTELAVSEGLYFYSTYEFKPTGAAPVSWQAFYRDAISGYTVSSQSVIDYTHYDDGSGTLASVPSGKYVRHAFFVVGDGAQEEYLFVYGRELYDTLLDAQNGTIPPKPGSWGGNIALIASIITENSLVPSEWITEIRDERPRIGFKASGLSVVTAHGDLTGLHNDDHTQYLLANGSRAMAGSLNMDSNNIINAGLINGVAITAHASRHQPGGADALPVGLPVGLGLANAEGIENTFARADHIHAHGDLAGGSLHALATSGGAGFMSATDKAFLDSLDPSLYLLRSGGTLTGSVLWNQPVGSAIAVNTNKFVVDAPTGNSLIGGTLGVAGTVTLSSIGLGLVHSDGAGILSSSLVNDTDIDPLSATFTGAALANAATNLNAAGQIVRRDASGNFAAGTITANLAGNASTATSATSFTGALSGDVTGTQVATVVASVGGQTAASVASAAMLANAATNLNTVNQIVRRDASGNFVAGMITADLVGNASTATSATSFTGSLSGDVTGAQGTTVVTSVGGQTAADVASAAVLANAATSLNTVNQIVKRDASGNFAAGTITANLAGNASTATSAANFTGSLSGDITGTQGTTVVASVGGQTAATVASASVLANAATNLNTGSQIVRRDASGNFAAGTITANLVGNASTATSSTNFTGSLSGDVTGSQGNTVVASVSGQTAADVASASVLANAATNLNTANQIVKRDASGNFAAGTITANVVGNASTATSATNFTGGLSGDVTGSQGTTVVASVGGQTAASVASASVLANAATHLNTVGQIVRRDGSGNFAAGTITANLVGNASTATSATNFTGPLNGDVTGIQGTTVVASVGGQAAATVASASVLANAATNLNTASQIVKRDASGNFAAGTITATLAGNASTATSATSFTGPLNGDVTGIQGATVVASVGGQTAENIAAATILANAATSVNTVNQIVRRDASGNFAAGTITANLVGNVTGSLTGTASNNVLKSGDTMTGSLTMANQNAIELRELTTNGTESVALRANASIPTSYVLTLPAVQGLLGQSLVNDGAGNLLWASISGGTLPRYTVHAYMNANFALPASSAYVVPYEVELIDLNGNYNPATYTYTAPVTGYYQVNASCSITSTNNNDRYIRLLKNGLPVTGYSYFWQGARVSGQISALMQLTAGDALQVQYQGRSADVIMGGGTSTLSIQFLTM